MTTEELQEAITRWYEENPEERRILAFIDSEGPRKGVREGMVAQLGISAASSARMILEAEAQSKEVKLTMHTYTILKSMEAIEGISLSYEEEEESSTESDEEPLTEEGITEEERKTAKRLLRKILGN